MSHVRYIDKTREYYAREGYTTAYRWAHFDAIPFTPLARPLARCRVGLVTTSEIGLSDEPVDRDKELRREVYALPTSVPVARLVSRKAAFDRHATTLDDVDTYLPLTHVRRLVAEGRFGHLAPRFQVVYSEYSQRKTMTVDAEEILRQCREDEVDVVLLSAV
jgi:glycine/sarcosine/betaine reductase selenoprotein B